MDKFYTCNGDDPLFFCPHLFTELPYFNRAAIFSAIYKLNRAAVFYHKKGVQIFGCHLLDCIIYT